MADYVIFRHSTPHSIVLLILYVDDMIITGSDPVVNCISEAASSIWVWNERFRFSLLFSWYWGCLLVSRLSPISTEVYCWSSWACHPKWFCYSYNPLLFPHLWSFISNSDAMMLLHYCSLHCTGNWWDFFYIFLLLDQIFFWLFISSVSLLVLLHQFIMPHYFVCFVIFEASSLDHCCTVLIRLFLYELILMLDGSMFRTHAAPPQTFAFFWVPLSFLV